MRRKMSAFMLIVLIVCCVLSGCSMMDGTSSTSAHITSGAVTQPQTESESCTLGIIKKIDTANKSITFWDYEGQSTLMYPYNDGTTSFSKSGTAITIEQLEAGMAADIYYDSKSDMMTKIQVSENKKVWVNTKVTSFSVDDVTRSFRIGKSLYKYTDDTLVFSEGKEITMEELNSEDQLTVYGFDTQIMSVIVDKGHGYVSLKGDKYFIGGYINIGSRIVKKVEEDMLIVVQEGNYSVQISNGDYDETRHIDVARNKNTVIDLSDVPPVVQKTGSVRFNINAQNPVLYVDGEKEDPAQILTLSAGEHDIRVTCDGYDDYVGKLHVGQNYSVVDINMSSASGDQAVTSPGYSEKETTDESAAGTETETETETDTDTETDWDTQAETKAENVVSETDKVTVSGPEGGFIYFDGKYMGTAPVTFNLVTGTHVISVLYDSQIKSYTVNLAEGGDPVTYDFTGK